MVRFAFDLMRIQNCRNRACKNRYSIDNLDHNSSHLISHLIIQPGWRILGQDKANTNEQWKYRYRTNNTTG